MLITSHSNVRVKALSDILTGIKALGLYYELENTKSADWKRVHVHKVLRKSGNGKSELRCKICKISIQYDMFNRCSFRIGNGYLKFAIILMLRKAVILNVSNYRKLKRQSYDNTVSFKRKMTIAKSKMEHKEAKFDYKLAQCKEFVSLFKTHYEL